MTNWTMDMLSQRHQQIDAEIEDIDKSELESTVINHSSNIIRNNVLDIIAAGNLSEDKWEEFVIQRYFIAEHFIDLLQSASQRAQENNELQLAIILHFNAKEELGIKKTAALGMITENSHDERRKEFLKSFGIGTKKLKNTTLYEGTNAYIEVLEELIQSDDYLEMAGAILLIENNVPGEFSKIITGLESNFPERYATKAADDHNEKLRKLRARKYIDNHIEHDSKRHFPVLLRELEKHANDPEKLQSILSGLQKISEAKIRFYEDLKAQLQL